jgi:predicted negative regulator of RcsB-dependent stress response
MTRAPFSRIGLLLFAYLAASSARADDLRDLYFGEALYYAQQGHYFEALQRLDTEVDQHYGLDEPQLDSLWYHIDDAEFSLGDFELRYRMHHRAGRAIRAVLEADVDEMVRNDAAYRLARIHFQKNQMADALSALQRIEGRIPEAIRDDIELLRAHVYMAMGQPSEAVAVLKGLSSGEDLRPFVSYNLGVAMLQSGQQQDALQQLNRAGQESIGGDAALAIRDKSNLVLGTILLEAGQYEEAKLYLDRVRLDGPFSTQALLSSGWADIYAENFERAIVPWGILAGREVTDSATQEALLSLPFAYGKLDVHGRAALYYGRALDAFGQEVDKLDASIESIRKGNFLEALIREEIRQNKDWVIRLRNLPETPETYYLMELLASHDFQTGLQNYLDLADLKRKLGAWQSSFDAYDDMVALREEHYAPLLPDVDREFRKLDSTMRLRLEQHRMLEQRLQAMLTAPRPEFLATGEERQLLARIEALEGRLQETGDAKGSDVDQRLRRLRGALTWNLETEYHERLTSLDRNLRELHAAVEVLREQYHQFVRVRQAASHSYEGYDTPIMRLRTRVREAAAKVDLLMARQGHVIEVVAIEELQARRQRLQTYQDQARFAMADSYDRATQAQARMRETE